MSSLKQNKNDVAGVYQQKAWDTAVDCLEVKQLPDMQAMAYVYEALLPPATLDDLAVIMAAVYADTYWTGIQMDPNKMSSSLQMNGWGKSVSDSAAKKAFSLWRGLMTRCNTGDFGNIPRVGTTTSSPDALNGGANVLPRSTMLNQWDSYFWVSGYVGKNNVYGRAQSLNIEVPIKNAKAHMYIYDAQLNPPPAPSGWQRLYTADGKDTTPLYGMEKPVPPNPIPPITPGQRVASDAFMWDNKSGPGHYCILHCPSTEFFTNDPTKIPDGNWNLWTWLANNGAAGWHNINASNVKEANILRFYNHDPIPEKFIFEAHCSKLPDGTEVTLECDDRDLPYEIKTRPMKTTSRYHLISTPLVQLPPYFEGELSVRIKTPGNKPLPPDATVEVRMIWILNHGHSHYEQAIEQIGAYRDGLACRPVRIQFGSFTYVGKVD